MFTHRLPLEEGPRAYHTFARKQDGCIKVALLPGGTLHCRRTGAAMDDPVVTTQQAVLETEGYQALRPVTRPPYWGWTATAPGVRACR